MTRHEDDSITDEEVVKTPLGREIEEFARTVGKVAHEFNNLLQTIIVSLELLDDMAQGRAEAQECFEAAFRAAERGNKLTRQLLVLAIGVRPEPDYQRSCDACMEGVAAAAVEPETV